MSIVKYTYSKYDAEYREPMTYSEYKSEKQRKQKAYNALRAQDIALQRQYNKEHRHGYCPKCHMLLPASGICDCDM